MIEPLSPAQVTKTDPKFKKGQVVMLATGKQMPFIILDVMLDDGVWFYAWNRKNYAMEAMIRALTPAEAGLCDSYDAQARRIAELDAESEGFAQESENLELRLAKVIRERNDATAEIERLKAGSSTVSDEVGRLKAKLAEAERDSARLDWMENHSLISPIKCQFGSPPVRAGKALPIVWTRYGSDEAPTLRAAIDAAMQPAEQAKEQG